MDMLHLQSPSNSAPNDLMDKAKHVWNMLDELASSDPTAYKSFIEKTLKDGKEWMAPPTPYLSVRSALLSNPNIKVFYLNIFTWLRLPTPSKSDELTKMYSLLPMETTHNGESCVVVSIAVHPNVMKMISRTQLIRSTFDLVASQHNLLVDYEHYSVLPDRVIGNVAEIQQNFVKPTLKKNKDNENIEESIDSDLSPSLIKQLSLMATNRTSPTKELSPRQQKKQKKPAKPPVLIEELWTIPTFTEEISSNNNFLIVRISLPDCQSVADCDVTVLPVEDTIRVECSKTHTHLALDMKKRKQLTPTNSQTVFDIGRLTAKFVRKTQQLILTIPILVEPSNDEQKEKVK